MRGSSLELAIVIAILGILAVYVISKYQGMLEEASSAQARAQLRAFRSALGIYYAKHGGVYPTYEEVASGSIFANGIVPYVEETVTLPPQICTGGNTKTTLCKKPSGIQADTNLLEFLQLNHLRQPSLLG